MTLQEAIARVESCHSAVMSLVHEHAKSSYHRGYDEQCGKAAAYEHCLELMREVLKEVKSDG